jgi:hypothetical protein
VLNLFSRVSTETLGGPGQVSYNLRYCLMTSKSICFVDRVLFAGGSAVDAENSPK